MSNSRPFTIHHSSWYSSFLSLWTAFFSAIATYPSHEEPNAFMDSQSHLNPLIQTEYDADPMPRLVTDGVVLLAFNLAAQKLFGLDKQDKGCSISQLFIDPDARDQQASEIPGCLRDIKLYPLADNEINGLSRSVHIQTKNNVVVPALIQLSTRVVRKKLIYVASVQDQSAVMEQKNLDKSKIAGLVHFQKNVITATKGTAEMAMGLCADMQAAVLSHDQEKSLALAGSLKDDLKFIHDSEDILLEGSVKHLNGLKSGDTMTLRPAAVSLKEIFGWLKLIFSKSLENQDNQLVIDYGTLENKYIFLDKERVTTVIENCLSNANKFTKSGTIRIVVKNLLDSENGKSEVVDKCNLQIEVIDNGCGVEENIIPTLFTEFKTYGTASVANEQGSGVGLWLSKKNVESMKGSIKIERVSAEGGTKMTVVIPTKFAENKSLQCDSPPFRTARLFSAATRSILKNEEHVVEISRPLNNLRICIADDGLVNLRILKNHLTGIIKNMHLPFPIDVVTAKCGDEALAHWRDGNIILLITDINMPEKADDKTSKAGLKITEIIRSHEALLHKSPIPIYSSSANADKEDIMEYSRVGMNGAINKPYSKAELEVVVRRALEDYQSRPSLCVDSKEVVSSIRV